MSELKAGRELDAMITEKAMGWTTVDVPGSGKWRTSADKTISCPVEICPPYSTDWNEAMKVRDKVLSMGPEKTTVFLENLNTLVARKKSGPVQDCWLYVEPFDICQAALKAVGAS